MCIEKKLFSTDHIDRFTTIKMIDKFRNERTKNENFVIRKHFDSIRFDLPDKSVAKLNKIFSRRTQMISNNGNNRFEMIDDR